MTTANPPKTRRPRKDDVIAHIPAADVLIGNLIARSRKAIVDGKGYRVHTIDDAKARIEFIDPDGVTRERVKATNDVWIARPLANAEGTDLAPVTRTDEQDELVHQAKREHARVMGAPKQALAAAIKAGEALAALKDSLPHGMFGPALEDAGIPARTSSHYINLHANADRIADAGSIMDALRILRPAPKARAKAAPSGGGGTADVPPVDTDQGEDYLRGYRAGFADGKAQAAGKPQLSKAAVKRLLKLVHPDIHPADRKADAEAAAKLLTGLL